MARRDLLPGVTTDSCPPVIITNSRRAITRARRRAALKDVAHVALLLTVDALFVHWPASHVPLLGRYDSALLVFALNAALAAQMTLCRAFPRWSARRIATTWCLRERARFFQSSSRQP